MVDEPIQIEVAPEIVAVGNEITVTVTEFDNVLVHEFAPDEVTFTNV
jgi:hypothetical protein